MAATDFRIADFDRDCFKSSRALFDEKTKPVMIEFDNLAEEKEIT